MRVPTSGGAGFMGSALANQLISFGRRLRVLDDLSEGGGCCGQPRDFD